MAKIGDKVRFLNAVGGGVISRIEGNMAYVTDEDGFDNPVFLRECVVVEEKKEKPTAYDRPPVENPQSKLSPVPVEAKKEEIPVVETTHGNKMNVVLAYEPVSLKQISSTSFYAYLVNDSNYYLDFTYLTKDDDGWHTRYHGVVEPNIQVLLEKFGYEQLPEMERVAVQFIAYKEKSAFELKSPVSVEYKLDGTKFYKLHSFKDNEYFDNPVLAFTIVKDDAPFKEIPIDAAALQEAMREKKSAENEKPRVSQKSEKRVNKVFEVDLHISALVDTTAGMSNSDMLRLQLDKFNETMSRHIKHKGDSIVFIHGKGEGVLRKAILDELKKKYKNCTAQDASFREYGFGATLVKIH